MGFVPCTAVDLLCVEGCCSLLCVITHSSLHYFFIVKTPKLLDQQNAKYPASWIIESSACLGTVIFFIQTS